MDFDPLSPLLRKRLLGGPIAALTKSEADAGRQAIPLGIRPWYQQADWAPGLLTTDGDEVRIILLKALRPNTGAFRRMVDGIIDDGLTPVVIEPMGLMRLILNKWGWEHSTTGKGWLLQNEWRPPS